MNGSEPARTQNSTPVVPLTNPDGQFARWWDEMLWHRVLRSASLGLRPGRLGLAFFLVLVGLLLMTIGRAIDAQLVPGGALMPWAVADADWLPVRIWQLFIATPLAWVQGWPVTTLIMGPIAIGIAALLLPAISRITAEEFARGRHMAWHEGLKFAAQLWRSSIGAFLGPIVLIWLIALICALFGWLLLNWPVLNIIGSLLYGAVLLMSLMAVIVGVSYILGAALLIPAVVCEGSDAIDAIQRAYAYVLARPLRLIIYLLLGGLGVAVVVVILVILLQLMLGFAVRATGAGLRPQGWNMVWLGTFSPAADPPPPQAEVAALEAPTGTYAVGMAFIRIWVLVPLLLLLASVVSTAMAAATVIYLAMRRTCDGQDLGELWMPGAVELAMKQVMESRQEAVKAYQPPATPPPG